MPRSAQRSSQPIPDSPAVAQTSFAPTMRSGLFDPWDSGVIVLSSSTRILHMNHRARTLMRLFGEAHEPWPNLAPESMPSILLEFCHDIMSELARRTEKRDWAQFEMRRVCHMVTPMLLLKGFGVPTSLSREPQMILTLQPCTAPPVSVPE
jgi:hypothetical protein